jgi:hypothetical protein
MSVQGARGRRIIPCVASAVAAAAATLACGGSQARAPDTVYLTAEDASESARLMPLEEGTVYTYDTHAEGSSEVGVMTIEVRDSRGGQVTLHFGGRTQHLRSAHDGIAIAEGGYLLKSPIVVDATWEGAMGTVRVASVDDSVEVPAGKFTGCVRTIEQERIFGGVRVITSLFCPHVGLASIDVRSKTEHQTALLRRHAPRIDPLIGVTPTTSEQ